MPGGYGDGDDMDWDRGGRPGEDGYEDDGGEDYTECQHCSTFTADSEVDAYESGWVCAHCSGFNEY
jgi:hypothetical protein